MDGLSRCEWTQYSRGIARGKGRCERHHCDSRKDTTEQGEPVSITVSFNVEIVAYEFLLFVEGSSEAVDNRLIPNSDMDRPDFDEFEIEIDTPGIYTAELRHLGVRLDTQEFTVVARPEPVHEQPEEEALEEEYTHEPEVVVATAGEGSFGEFVAVLEAQNFVATHKHSWQRRLPPSSRSHQRCFSHLAWQRSLPKRHDAPLHRRQVDSSLG